MTLSAEVLKYLGRKPSYDRKVLATVTDMLNQGAGTSAIAKVTGLSRQAVLRIKADPVHAEVVLTKWEKDKAKKRQHA